MVEAQAVVSQAKKLGPVAIFLVSISAILGASDFYYLAGYSAKIAGPFALVAWLVLAVFSILVATYFAELISLFPSGGGVYAIVKQTYSRFKTFMFAWLLWIVGNYSMALAVLATVEYLLPYNQTRILIAGAVFGIFWIIILNYFAFHGMAFGSYVLATFGILTVSMCLFTIIPSFIDIPGIISTGAFSTHFTIDHFLPFYIHEGSMMRVGYLLMTVYLISELYFGFESVSFLAPDTKDPEKTLPNALLMVVGIVIVLLLLYFIASLGVLPLGTFTNAMVPFGDIARVTLGPIAEKVAVLGIYLIILGGAALWPITGARLIKSMAQDKLFVAQMADPHPRTGTPYKAIIFQTLAVITFFLVLMREFLLGYKDPYEIGHAQYVFLNLIVLFVVLSCVSIWRKRAPHKERAFKAPLGTIGPIFMIIVYIACFVAWLYLDTFFAWTTVKKGLALIFLGIPLYLTVEFHYNKHFIVKANDWLAYFTLFLERFSLPKKIIDSIHFLLGDIAGKRVLEYGCSVGTLTGMLAHKVMPGGVLYATDLSKKRAHIAQKRIDRDGHRHVQVLHDEEHASRVHPDVPQVDIVVSVSMVGYVLDVESVLLQLNNRLPVGGKICIVENDKYFRFIPNVPWLSKDDNIKDVFAQAGFKVDVTRTQGLLWEYVFIYGDKIQDLNVGGDSTQHFNQPVTPVPQQAVQQIPVPPAYPQPEQQNQPSIPPQVPEASVPQPIQRESEEQ